MNGGNIVGKILGAYLMPHPPIILKEVGRGEEKKVNKTVEAMETIARDIQEKKPKNIIVITPHGPVFSDGVAISVMKELKGNMGQFGAREVKFIKENNQELVNKIISYANRENIVCAMVNNELAESYDIPLELDHGTMVPLYFIDKEYIHYKLVHITYGLLSYEELYNFGIAIKEALEDFDEDGVIIASGDLSHRLKDDGPYGYNPAGPKFDEFLIEKLREKDFEAILNPDENLIKEAGECGFRSISTMLGALDGYDVDVRVLSYEGELGVGYGVAKIDILARNNDRQLLQRLITNRQNRIRRIREKEDEYVKLARKSLEYYIKTGKRLELPKDIPEEMIKNKAGTFVSIKKYGELRGCIGTIKATEENIALEIVENAIKAGTQDPRFYPVNQDELQELVYSVDVLGEPEEVNSLDDLDEKRYGVIVSSGRRSGLLLPNLEGVNSVEEQIRIALNKAGIGANEGYNIQRFEVIRHR